jgi:DNA-binding NarL/FixJ family response regulator
VLVVDDHALLSEALAAALEAEGFAVDVVSGPTFDDVVDRARAVLPDVVLLDLWLGDDFGSGVLLVEPLSSLGSRVVIVTGATDDVLLANCLEVGAIGIIPKSVGFDVLVDGVRRALEGRAVMTERERQRLLAVLRDYREEQSERLAPFEQLTPREREVLVALIDGRTAQEIAAAVPVSIATVRTQIHSVLAKLGVTTQLAAVAIARRAGWPDPPQPS